MQEAFNSHFLLLPKGDPRGAPSSSTQRQCSPGSQGGGAGTPRAPCATEAACQRPGRTAWAALTSLEGGGDNHFQSACQSPQRHGNRSGDSRVRGSPRLQEALFKHGGGELNGEGGGGGKRSETYTTPPPPECSLRLLGASSPPRRPH